MQVDLLLAEAQRGAPLAKRDDLHPEYPCVEFAGARDIGDGQHEMVETGDLHFWPPCRDWNHRSGLDLILGAASGEVAARLATASGSSSICSASLNLLKKPKSVMRSVSSTICASLNCARSRSNSASGMRFGRSQAAIAYSTTSRSMSSSSG